MTSGNASDRSAEAGEYVLGTLRGAELDDFERRLANDAALRVDVAYWQDRLLALTRQAAPVEPAGNLWPRIEARLPPLAAPAAAPVPIPAPAPRRAAPTPSWWQRLGFWQGVSGLALAASVMLASTLVLRMQAPPVERYVAVLQAPQGGGNGWVVEVRLDPQGGNRLLLRPVAPSGPVPAGRALQFWTKAPGASGPSSLGLVRAGAPLELPLPLPQELRPEQLFEITLEPEGGSPIGRPTGPILYVGRAVRLES